MHRWKKDKMNKKAIGSHFLNSDAADRYEAELTEQIEKLTSERDFVDLTLTLRECLGLELADVDLDRCLEILAKCKTFTVTQLMLLRNPECVDIMRRLCRYKGNLEVWKLSPKQEAEFNKKTEVIRSEAEMIYNGFEKLFTVKPKQVFWEHFTEQVQWFEKCTKNMSDSDILSLNEKTYKKIQDTQKASAASNSPKNVTGHVEKDCMRSLWQVDKLSDESEEEYTDNGEETRVKYDSHAASKDET